MKTRTPYEVVDALSDVAPDLEPLNEAEQKLLDRLLRSIPKQIEALRAEGAPPLES